MTNPTPLNPDALEAARFALTRSERAFGRDGKPADPLHIASAIVSAYLAVAQPVVHPSEGERRVRELHSKEPARYYGTDLNPNNKFDCSCCGEGRPWPCATIRTLDAAQPEVQANSKPNQNFEVVNSVEELDALPVQSVIEDADGCIFEVAHNGERNSNGTFYREYLMTGDIHPYDIDEIDLPATVLKRAPETPRR